MLLAFGREHRVEEEICLELGIRQRQATRMSRLTNADDFPSFSLSLHSHIGDHFRLRVALRFFSGSRVSTIPDSSPWWM